MNELIVFLVMTFVACIFMPAGAIRRILSNKSSATACAAKSKRAVPEDSLLRRHFLTHLRTEVEAELVPNSMDLALRHYYDASVAAEFQKRLSEMAG